MSFDVNFIRAQFPALDLTVNGHPAAFFDGPGGTQTPRRVIDRMTDYLIRANANTGGYFLTSERNDAMLDEARAAFADFMGCDADEVAFCHNSTTISFKLAHAIARDLKPGDEIILTDMDHEANRGPWEGLAERGLVIRSVRMNPETCTLDMDDLRRLLGPRTKVVAFNWASNAVGTIGNAAAICRIAREAGALTIVDAVHYALHGVIDVRAVGMDFVFCSAYKFFGPHVGVLYGRRVAMARLKTLRVGAQYPEPPSMFETGTLNHEGIAGAAEAVDFIADIGARFPGAPAPEWMKDWLVSDQSDMSDWSDKKNITERRKHIIAGMLAIEEHERPLADYFKAALRQIPGLRLYGPPAGHPCTSTISFRLDGLDPADVARRLGDAGIFTWAGNFYAVRLVETLGLNATGGLVRIGLAPYNTREEIDRALDVLRAMV